jgi:hypothetical protein
MAYDIGVDFTHSAVKNVPPAGPYTHVLGYTSGTEDIVWTPSDWGKFIRPIRIRINQGFGSKTPNMADYDVLDVENGAWSVQEAADEVERRVEAGYQWTTLYGSDAALGALADAIKAKGKDIWNGHVDCILADWNLDEAEAAKIVGAEVHSMTCRAVQWASPTSNPNTLLPGTSMTLREANVDLNVVQPGWNPPVVPKPRPVPVPVPEPKPVPVPEPVPTPVPVPEPKPVPVPVPVPEPVPDPVPVPVPAPNTGVAFGYVVWCNSSGTLTARYMSSDDDGLTWH